jgi:hypothetical protein
VYHPEFSNQSHSSQSRDRGRYLPGVSFRFISGSLSHASVAVNRYSAKLLFQFRVDIGSDSGKRRLCEERIVVVHARSAQVAIKKSNRRGKSAEHSYVNDEGNNVYFEFIGIMDLLELGPECEDDEVWYDIKERLLPMERRDRLIPPESDLNAIRSASQGGG